MAGKETIIEFVRTPHDAKIAVLFPFRASTANSYEKRMEEDTEALHRALLTATSEADRQFIAALITIVERSNMSTAAHYRGNDDIKARFYTQQEKEALA
jgi:hypothetical protein